MLITGACTLFSLYSLDLLEYNCRVPSMYPVASTVYLSDWQQQIDVTSYLQPENWSVWTPFRPNSRIVLGKATAQKHQVECENRDMAKLIGIAVLSLRLQRREGGDSEQTSILLKNWYTLLGTHARSQTFLPESVIDYDLVKCFMLWSYTPIFCTRAVSGLRGSELLMPTDVPFKLWIWSVRESRQELSQDYKVT